MIPRPLLAVFVLILLFSAACGGDGDSDDDNTTENAAQSTPAAQAESDDESEEDSEELELTQDYLQGEWCSYNEGEEEGTTYIFDGNSFEYGRGDKLGSGGNIPTFLIGSRIISVEENQFVLTEFGREVTYTRESCP